MQYVGTASDGWQRWECSSCPRVIELAQTWRDRRVIAAGQKVDHTGATDCAVLEPEDEIWLRAHGATWLP
jgi:hypothetical protein